MALVNTHPDYLREAECLALYEDFLRAMADREGYWHTLPSSVARWWKQRTQFLAQPFHGHWGLSDLAGACPSTLRLEEF
jgi:hypothetical protein